MALRLTLKTEPGERITLAGLTPSRLAGRTSGDIENHPVGRGQHPVNIGDVFTISGDISDGALVIEGGSPRFDDVAAGLDGGSVTVKGDVGHYAGHRMTGGRLEIEGSARHHLASTMIDGLVTVSGSVGDRLGAPKPGERDGMLGGAVIINGSAGDLCGERQRRGLVLIKGDVGQQAGGRMLGGTLWALKGFGDCVGIQMRRGTILTPRLDAPMATFLDCGEHRLGILTIMARHYAEVLGDLAPPLPTGLVRRFAGDTASIGRGEILVYGDNTAA